MSDTRSQIGDALAGKLTQEQLDTLMNEILEITKKARGWCPNCSKQVWVEIPDAKSVTGALVDLSNQAWGRPQDQAVEEQGVTFVRRVVYGGAEDVADA